MDSDTRILSCKESTSNNYGREILIMANILQTLTDKNIAHPPEWLPANTVYLVNHGSHAYGTNTKDSDYDVYGICIPPLKQIFPHLEGEIFGFGNQKKRFEQYQEGHLIHPNGQEYDFQIYSIVKYFHLAMGANPNIIEALFVPQECILHMSRIGTIIRENRHIFLSKKAKYTYLGYAFSQRAKAFTQTKIGNRKELVEAHGFDTKNAYHLLRLLDYAEQILNEHDIDLRRNNEKWKAVRRGEVTKEEINDIFNLKEKQLETLYQTSTLQHSPDENKIKTVLLNCLEEHYGSLTNIIRVEGKEEQCIGEIRKVLANYGY